MLLTTENQALFSQFEKSTDHSIIYDVNKHYYTIDNGVFTKVIVVPKNDIANINSGAQVTIYEGTKLTIYYEQDPNTNEYVQTADSWKQPNKTYYSVKGDLFTDVTSTITEMTPLTFYQNKVRYSLPYKFWNDQEVTVYGVSKEDTSILEFAAPYYPKPESDVPYTYEIVDTNPSSPNYVPPISYSLVDNNSPSYTYDHAKRSAFYRLNGRGEYFLAEETILHDNLNYYCYAPNEQVTVAGTTTFGVYYLFKEKNKSRKDIYIKAGETYVAVSNIYDLPEGTDYYINTAGAGEENHYVKIQVTGYGYEEATADMPTVYYSHDKGLTYTEVEDPTVCRLCFRNFYFVRKSNGINYYSKDVNGNYVLISDAIHYEKIKYGADENPQYRYILTLDTKFSGKKDYYLRSFNTETLEYQYTLDKPIYDGNSLKASTDIRFKESKEYLIKSGNNYKIENTTSLIGYAVNYSTANVTIAEPGSAIKPNTLYFTLEGNDYKTFNVNSLNKVPETPVLYSGTFTEVITYDSTKTYYRFNSNTGIYEYQASIAETDFKSYFEGINPTADTTYSNKTFYYKEETTYIAFTPTAAQIQNKAPITISVNREMPRNVLTSNGFDPNTDYYIKEITATIYYTLNSAGNYEPIPQTVLENGWPQGVTVFKRVPTDTKYYIYDDNMNYFLPVSAKTLLSTGWLPGVTYYVRRDTGSITLEVASYDTCCQADDFYFSKTGFNNSSYKFDYYTDKWIAKEITDELNPLPFFQVESTVYKINSKTVAIRRDSTTNTAYRDISILRDTNTEFMVALLDLSGTITIITRKIVIEEGTAVEKQTENVFDNCLGSAYPWIALNKKTNSIFYALSTDGYLATVKIGIDTSGNIDLSVTSIKSTFPTRTKDWRDFVVLEEYVTETSTEEMIYALAASGMVIKSGLNVYVEKYLPSGHVWKNFAVRDNRLYALALNGQCAKISRSASEHLIVPETTEFFFDDEDESQKSMCSVTTEYCVATMPAFSLTSPDPEEKFTGDCSKLFFWQDYSGLYAVRNTKAIQPGEMTDPVTPYQVESYLDRVVAVIQDLDLEGQSSDGSGTIVNTSITAEGVVIHPADQGTYYPTFTTTTGEVRSLYVDNNNDFSYNAGTNTLYVDKIDSGNDGKLTTGTIEATGNISTTGTISASQFIGEIGVDGYSLNIASSNGGTFRPGTVSTTLSAVLYKNGVVVQDLPDNYYEWTNTKKGPTWKKWGQQINITSEDCSGRTVFICKVYYKAGTSYIEASYTIMDFSDGYNLVLDVTSNKPASVIYNLLHNTCNPEWSESSPLIITPTLHRIGDTENLLEHIKTIDDIKWQKRINGGSWTDLDGESGKESQNERLILTVKQNKIKNSVSQVEYRLSGTFNDPETDLKFNIEHISTFTRNQDLQTIEAQAYCKDGNIFKNSEPSALNISAALRSGDGEIVASAYQWEYLDRSSSEPEWKPCTGAGAQTSTLIVTPEDVQGQKDYHCKITLSSGGTVFTSNSITIIDQTDPFQAVIQSTGGSRFKNKDGSSVLTCLLYQDGKEIDVDGTKYNYVWTKMKKDGTKDGSFTPTKVGSTFKSIKITSSDVDTKATFYCDVKE